MGNMHVIHHYVTNPMYWALSRCAFDSALQKFERSVDGPATDPKLVPFPDCGVDEALEL